MAIYERGPEAPRGWEVLFGREEISAATDNVASALIDKYRDKDPLFVPILMGGYPWSAKLMESMARQDPAFNPRVEFWRLKSYEGDSSMGFVKILQELVPDEDLAGREIVLIDDVSDTNLSLTFGKTHLYTVRKVAKVESVVLVNKNISSERIVGPPPDIAAFQAPDIWLAGMGMDAGNEEVPDELRYYDEVLAKLPSPQESDALAKLGLL